MCRVLARMYAERARKAGLAAWEAREEKRLKRKGNLSFRGVVFVVSYSVVAAARGPIQPLATVLANPHPVRIWYPHMGPQMLVYIGIGVVLLAVVMLLVLDATVSRS